MNYGANDMGSVMMEENVVSAAGTTYCLNEAMICRLIRDAGYVPAQRDNEYNLLRLHADSRSPDLSIDDWSKLRTQGLHVETVDEPHESVALTVNTAQLNQV